jgi:hypothetical protein
VSYFDASYEAGPPAGTQMPPQLPVTQATTGALRRWRQALADAQNNAANIVVIGDSHVFGQFADGNDDSNASRSAADGQLGWVGQLRGLFAQTYGDVGEGFIIPDPVLEARMTNSGGSTFSGVGQAVAPMRHNWRLTSGSTLTFTPAKPAGVRGAAALTKLGLIQTNHAGDAALTWTLNGSAQTAPTAPTGTGIPTSQDLTIVDSQAVVLTGPAANNTIYGVTYKTGQVGYTGNQNGVFVHRIGSGGQTQGIMLGGDFNGQLGTVDGSTFFTTAQQQANVQSHYIWAAPRGLVIIYFGTNEQSLQLGSAGLNNGITPAIFNAGLQLTVNQIIADGWCVLLVGPPASASELQTGNAQPTQAYRSIMAAIAASTDHVAYVSISDLWGGDSAAAKLATSNAGLRNAGDSHPTRAGYGDIARNLYTILNYGVPPGN